MISYRPGFECGEGAELYTLYLPLAITGWSIWKWVLPVGNIFVVPAMTDHPIVLYGTSSLRGLCDKTCGNWHGEYCKPFIESLL